MDTSLLEPHFLQSKYWEEVRAQMGHRAERVGKSLLLVKPVPIGRPLGYMPQVYLQNLDWDLLVAKGKELGLSHIQIDPSDLTSQYALPVSVKEKYSLLATESIYYRHTSVLELQQDDERLMEQMKPKTRYNTRLSLKKEVNISIDDSEDSFNIFLELFFQTVERQKYYGRDKEYYETIWNTLRPKGVVKIATAFYKEKPLVSWMLFLGENKVIYYPYGGSSEEERNRMPTNALVWGIIQWGKSNGYKFFDLWGVLPDDAKESEKGYGFSRFKKGFGGKTIDYVQSYDIVISKPWYQLFKIGNKLRWFYLSLRKLF